MRKRAVRGLEGGSDKSSADYDEGKQRCAGPLEPLSCQSLVGWKKRKRERKKEEQKGARPLGMWLTPMKGTERGSSLLIRATLISKEEVHEFISGFLRPENS